MVVQTLEFLPIRRAERRRSPRRRPAHNTVCRLTDDDGEEIGYGLVWNLSCTGVSMLLNVMLAPGCEVGAELISASRATVHLRLSVVHLSPLRTGDFVLGGHFDRPLDEAELLPFII